MKKLIKGAQATAENEIQGFEANKVIDGKNDTCWKADSFHQWWKTDLMRNCDIYLIKLNTGLRTEGYSHYLIEYSKDNLNWEIAIKKTNDIFEENGEEYNVSISARYLRVTFLYCSKKDESRINDFQIFGYESSEQSLENDSKISPYKFLAITYDEASGFVETETQELEPGYQNQVMMGDGTGSYLVFRNVDFTGKGVDQFRGLFGLTNPDGDKQITIEIRLDHLDGKKVGEMTLFKQWKQWSVLAEDLVHTNGSLLTGIHDVYLVIIASESTQKLMINWLAFVQKTALPVPKPLPNTLNDPSFDNYKIYFGNLHSHTGFSDGISVPEHAFDYARYTAGLDFLAITEHSNLYDYSLDWDKSQKWADIKKTASNKTEDGKFLALAGSETTWYNEFGHMNTYNMDFFINTYEMKYNNISNYYDLIKQYPSTIHQWNHPWFHGGKREFDGFEPYDAELDKVLHMIELNPYESKEFGGLYHYVKALDIGWHVSPVGSQDNHDGQWGTMNTLRTGVLVEKLTRNNFFDAIRHNRVYFTSSPQLKVWFRINNKIMGSRIKSTGKLDFDIKALYGTDTKREIIKAEIIGEKGEVYKTINVSGKTMDVQVQLPCNDRYYFVKVYQDDGEFAVTSPIWIEKD